MTHGSGVRNLRVTEEGELREQTTSYDNILKDVEELWKQKSGVAWLNEGDSNTRFFHCSTVVTRNW